ncbi:MAG: hypothetical protein CVU78_06850 [Elusimicrobia bacterium HGW-Elusimicrobia-2]|nr:MAG: hypothetical protein CVU78_06850 [Elusimicrobia bacterium HGW-Elusimicrobia-2]
MNASRAIEKMVDKYDRVVTFRLSKIVNSIILTIIDVESANRWIAERRARKYADVIQERIYDTFYNFDWLIHDFLKKYISFNPEERLKRLNHAFITERLCIAALKKFKEESGKAAEPDDRKDLAKFIDSELKKSIPRKKYDGGLFPGLCDAENKEISAFLLGKFTHYAGVKLSKKQVYPGREYIMDMIEKTLKEIGETEIAESFMIFREGKNKIKNGEISALQFTNNGIPYEVCRKTLEWNIAHDCESLFNLNDWILGRGGKDIRELIDLSEKRFRDDVAEAVDKIMARKSEIKMIIIAGPSCSNKTTTTVIAGRELSKIGLKLKQLNVDDYFKNLEDQPKDEFGDYDFEMPEAIDIELLNEHFGALLKGLSIQKPSYNFKSGKRDAATEFHLADDEILLIDCLHGLYRSLTRSVSASNKFRIYIESMNILRNIDGAYTRWSDIRMMKRMVRDFQHRGYSPKQTLAHWPYVRKGELKHIIPYICSTDAVINAGMPYELPALKKVLKPIMPDSAFIKQLRNDGRLDPYIRGMRTLALVDAAAEMTDLNVIPGTSPLREFIGGSEYEIPHND